MALGSKSNGGGSLVSSWVPFLLGAAAASVTFVFFLSASPPNWAQIAAQRPPGTIQLQEVPACNPSTPPVAVASSNSLASSSSSSSSSPTLHDASSQGNTSDARAPRVPRRIRGGNKQTEAIDRQFIRVVSKAAMDDNTVIMTSVNGAWAAPGSLMDTFFESFTVGEDVEQFARHVLIVAMDENAFQRCTSTHRHCYLMQQDGGVDLAGEQSYMKGNYLDLVWSKVKLQQWVLELGYNLLFTDVDIAWFRNPFEHINLAAHISTSSDFYFGFPNDLNNYPNTGFIYFKACEKNVRVMEYWREARWRFPDKHDQFVFNEIKQELVSKIGVRIKFIDAAYISGFCQLGRDLRKIATVHMTCCIGLKNKLHDLKHVVKDWRRYMTHPHWERQMGNLNWTFNGGVCIH